MTALDNSLATIPQQCPTCGHMLNRVHRDIGQREPKAGDITICEECAALAIFIDDAGHLRKPNQRDAEILKADPKKLLRIGHIQMEILTSKNLKNGSHPMRRVIRH